jgi:anaerobic ribonucleoside-triphosphate reductase activating protein
MQINIGAVIPLSTVNGPGHRAVIFFQGCRFDCEGCFNAELREWKTVRLVDPETLLAELLNGSTVEGITVSGGEPFEQADGLARLLFLAKRQYRLSTIVFSGYRYEELVKSGVESKDIDVLIEGRYVALRPDHEYLRGSRNQRIMLLSDRYRMADLRRSADMELTFSEDGNRIVTGFGKLMPA